MTDNSARRTWGRIGGLKAWAQNDPETLVGPAHRAFRSRFERLVDPTGRLDPAERTVRADRARRAYMLTLAAKSAAVRRKTSAAQQEKAAPVQELRRDADTSSPR